MKSNPAKTVLTISMGLALIYLYNQVKSTEHYWQSKINWLLAAAIIIGVIGVFSETMSRWMEIVWMKLAYILSLIVPNIILGIVFFLFLLPLSLLSRLFRKEDALVLKNNISSVYKTKNKEYDKAHFENMW